jgi:hypothetical protein
LPNQIAKAVNPRCDFREGYRISTAQGAVSNFGDAPADGGMSGTTLNWVIIAAAGF